MIPVAILSAVFALAAPLSLVAGDADTENDTDPKSSYRSVRSPGGFVAHSLRFATSDGNHEGRVFIEKDGRVIATLVGVRAVSFSPVDDILLVCEDIADHDLRHYFLDIGSGQYARTEKRSNYVVGSPYVNRAEWSNDGKFVVLYDHPGITDQPPTVVTVSEKLGD